LEVRTRRRVTFNQDVALDSVSNPKHPISLGGADLAGIGNSALDVLQKRARVSPFERFSSSGITQTPIR
jgi:hypothetical protein